ncbi:EAL domain-containing protein [Paucilactobacillus suebicus]|uniref:C-di-GMP-specific phosphodiesterase n=1 Tax=Paucilactobacillus suebicus DSM 5007 = KCTC 3549 TaxID=1423807 RepID=A0A0R1W669_9LACO|nr:EAL domain-containing protein [Paucilactobacillus suebicus]KRM11428.1 C-di-GMP-specific phosphodiesterase [Paucilactobacillus suebicus DSM 5007 = KCTC 3549]
MKHTFFGQPMFHVNKLDRGPVGYELFTRELKDGIWQLPDDFHKITSTQLERLLNETIESVPDTIQLLSFNLEPDQFINSEYIEMVARVQEKTNIKIFTELTERGVPNVTADQLYDAAKKFHGQGSLVCIDDVGTGENSPSLVMRLNPYIDQYKFAFQNFRPFTDINKVTSKLDYWYNLAQEKNKILTIEGLETQNDYDIVIKEYPCYIIQGYFTGKPEKIEN